MSQMMKDMLMLSASDVFRQFIPSEHGESLDEQIYPWSADGIGQKLQQPLSADEADPKTINNILQMRAVEMQHWMHYHTFSKMVTDERFKKLAGAIARAEHMHFWKLHSLLPIPSSHSETLLKEELALLACYDRCSQNEPNESVKSAFSHIGMDHLQHAEFAMHQVEKSGKMDVNRITAGMDLTGGKPLDQQFMKPDDTFWQGQMNGVYSKADVDPQTLINVDQSLAGELAAWTGYACAATFESDSSVKSSMAAMSSVEDQHVAILSSIKDPSETLLERALVHEQVEVRNYRMMMEQEENPKVRKAFEDLYREDMEQARLFGQFA